jgi:hypothetical protein
MSDIPALLERVRVKPLEWEPAREGFCKWRATTPFSVYEVAKYGKQWAVYFNDDLIAEPEGEEAAKAAAEADYRERILSALVPTPAPDAEPAATMTDGEIDLVCERLLAALRASKAPSGEVE